MDSELELYLSEGLEAYVKHLFFILPGLTFLLGYRHCDIDLVAFSGLCWGTYLCYHRIMDTLAAQATNSLQSHSTPLDVKLDNLTSLKQEIKHRHCPESAIPSVFNTIRISLATPHTIDAGFSILGHLTKRLLIQNLHAHLHAQTLKLFPVLLERLGDAKDRLRQRAIAALGDLYVISDASRRDVEQLVRETALTSKNPKTKVSAMQWIVIAHTEKSMLFRAFVPNIVTCLEDADGDVRHTAQTTTIKLFSDAGMRSKHDLQKRLQEHAVRKSIETHILTELGLANVARSVPNSEQPPTPASQVRKDTRTETSQKSRPASSDGPPPEAQPMSIAEQEASKLTPLYIESSRDLEETFREMHPWFEGKEAESNWLKREKCAEKLRRIVQGNAPNDYTTLFLANIKTLLDGILKTVNSLRTTVCTIGCHLVQDLARVCGSGLDNMVEILLQNLIKLCGNTKKISATKANDTVIAIMANVTYHVRLLQHIHAASQDKNVQPRTYACGWLKTVLTKSGSSKHLIEHSGGLNLIEKTIKIGLNDSNPSVRENMRPVYWAFAKMWSDASETIMSTLSQSHQDMLVKHSASPFSPPASSSLTSNGKSAFSKSAGAVPAKPSIKEAIAARKRAQAAGKDLPERPGSAAETTMSPVKATAPARPATAMSTSNRHISSQSTGTLSSAPVRPRRRADMTKASAGESKIAKAETPQGSPAISPAKTRPKTPGFAQSAMKLAPKKVHSPAASPAKSSAKKAASIDASPTRAAEDFTMVIPSLNRGVTTSISEDSASHTQPATFNRISPVTANSLADDVNLMSIHGNVSRPMGFPTLSDGRPSPTPEMPHTHEDLSQPDSFPAPGVDQQSAANSLPPNHKDASQPMSNSAHGDGRQSPNGSIQRISMSPQNIVGRKENLHSRALYMQELRPLKVYEDPVDEISLQIWPTCPNTSTALTPRALGELPINEPASQNRIAGEQELRRDNNADGRTAHHHEDWISFKQSEIKRMRETENVDNPMLARKMLESGIVRIQARSLDVHGFRKLQGLIPSAPESLWEDGYRMQELLVPLLEYLEANIDFTDVRDAIRDLDIKTQILVVIKLLMKHQPEYCEPFYAQTLCSLVTARKNYHPSTHMVAGLEETAQEVIANCNPADSMVAVMDLMDIPHAIDTRTMGLSVLKGLLRKCYLMNEAPDINRLAAIVTKYLDSTKPDIRRGALELVLELRGCVNEELFWALLGNTKGDFRGLITYYLARNASGQST